MLKIYRTGTSRKAKNLAAIIIAKRFSIFNFVFIFIDEPRRDLPFAIAVCVFHLHF